MAKLNKHDQRWIYDFAIKESGTVLHLQGITRGMLPQSVRQLDMVSKHLGRAGLKVEKLADTEAARNHRASALDLYFEAANIYSNAGSMYIASESLLSLGRAADDAYWTGASLPWTTRLAYSGGEFPQDNYVSY